MVEVTKRKQFPQVWEDLGYKIAVEVGVHRGGFSEYILANSNNLTLFSVDPWTDINGVVREDIKKEATDKLAKFGARSIIAPMTSVNAAKQFPDASIDVVYIDGLHSYAACKEDMDAWIEKIKPGGILAGHDYKSTGKALMRDYAGDLSKQERAAYGGSVGVKQAVDEFVKDLGYDLKIIQEKAPGWWFFVN